MCSFQISKQIETISDQLQLVEMKCKIVFSKRSCNVDIIEGLDVNKINN